MDTLYLEIGYPLRSPNRSRSVLKTHKKTPMYGLISTHSYRIGNKGKFHNHESDVDTQYLEYRVPSCLDLSLQVRAIPQKRASP